MSARHLALAVTLGSLCTAQTPTWTQLQATTSPPPRHSHAMTYDAARQRVVLFGGESSTFKGTWEWDGRTWTQSNPATSPLARGAHAMVYDAARQRVVLFGGMDGTTMLADTWEWDGARWTPQLVSVHPPVRAYHGMAYDESRQRVVVFGGLDKDLLQLDDTWEWDGSAWQQMHPTTSPSARPGTMAYDAARQRVVLFSGDYSAADTWEWDGTVWTRMQPATSPPARQAHAMAYHAARRRVVLFGGTLSGNTLGDTWEWDGTAWVQIQPTSSPAARFYHAVAYDAARQALVLFGGVRAGSFGDTWGYGSGRVLARATPYGASCGPALAPAAGSRPILGAQFTLDSTGFAPAATSGLMIAGASNTFYLGFPLPLRLDFLGMNGCDLHTSLDAAWALSVRSGAGSFSIHVPNAPGLLGAKVYLQSAAGSLTTNGVEVVLGDW